MAKRNKVRAGSSVFLRLSLSVFFAGCFSKTKVDVSNIVCMQLDDCPSGYVCVAPKCVSVGTSMDASVIDGKPDTTPGTVSEAGTSDMSGVDGRLDLGTGSAIDSSGAGGTGGSKDGGTEFFDSSIAGSGGGGGGAGGVQTDVGGAGEGDAPTDAPQVVPDGNVTCTAPKVLCNGDCIDPSTSCCVATDCKTSCMTCGANHACAPVRNQSDPSLHCTGTCDPTGACKAAQGQPCTAGTDCANGTCADGYCCDNACTGSCHACDVSGKQGTCTPLGNGASPHLNHPACSGTDVCVGYCNGTSPSCTYPPATTSCGTISCSSSGAYQAAGTCSSGTCNMPAPEPCTYACVLAKGGVHRQLHAWDAQL